MRNSKRQKIIKAIQDKGCLLVFPLENRKEPSSIWSVLYPRTPMRWEWDSNGDNRVGELWVLREELSRSGQVIYSKWYQNRASLGNLTSYEGPLVWPFVVVDT